MSPQPVLGRRGGTEDAGTRALPQPSANLGCSFASSAPQPGVSAAAGRFGSEPEARLNPAAKNPTPSAQAS